MLDMLKCYFTWSFSGVYFSIIIATFIGVPHLRSHHQINQKVAVAIVVFYSLISELYNAQLSMALCSHWPCSHVTVATPTDVQSMLSTPPQAILL